MGAIPSRETAETWDRDAFISRQQRGVHFVASATISWAVIAILQWIIPGALAKNFATFVASCLLLPGAWLLARVWRVPFQDPSPWARLGMVLSMSQVLYLPIALWVYPSVPNRLVMVLAVITTAHLFPFWWLYDSRIYLLGAVAGTVMVFVAGVILLPALTAAITAGVLACMAVGLMKENRWA